jgi:tRNA 2-selenouridine synthase
VTTIIGGYKAFRSWVLEVLDRPYSMKILGGYTGTGKTEMLHYLHSQGNPILDLEKLANHKGSTFGHIGMDKQPSQEHFENLIAIHLSTMHDQTMWVEDESQRIGTVLIPKSFFEQMIKADLYFINDDFDRRLQKIIKEYGCLPVEELVKGVKRIEKKLGGLSAKNACELLEKGAIKEAMTILLTYYDKWYKLYHESHTNDRRSIIDFESREKFIEECKSILS